MNFEELLVGQVYVNMIVSPISDNLAILIMLEGEDVLRFYLTLKKDGDFKIIDELHAFRLDDREQALDFAMNITEYSAIDFMVIMGAKHFNYYEVPTQ